MKTKTQRELNMEYWGRVYDMCDSYNKQHGTSISPQQCVKNDGYIWNSKVNPLFDGRKYDLAVAIIEGKPVFVGDKIYTKRAGQEVTVSEGFLSAIDYTLTQPQKRTFELNGKELPCPSNNEFCDTYMLDIIGVNYYFESMEDRNIVARELLNLIADARDKD